MIKSGIFQYWKTSSSKTNFVNKSYSNMTLLKTCTCFFSLRKYMYHEKESLLIFFCALGSCLVGSKGQRLTRRWWLLYDWVFIRRRNFLTSLSNLSYYTQPFSICGKVNPPLLKLYPTLQTLLIPLLILCHPRVICLISFC